MALITRSDMVLGTVRFVILNQNMVRRPIGGERENKGADKPHKLQECRHFFSVLHVAVQFVSRFSNKIEGRAQPKESESEEERARV